MFEEEENNENEVKWEERRKKRRKHYLYGFVSSARQLPASLGLGLCTNPAEIQEDPLQEK